MKVYLSTLGCKLNESEIEAWARQFTGAGHEIVDDPARADYIVLNTCTVTQVAERKSRQMARQLARSNPNAKLALTGCFVSVTPEQAQKLPNVALVVPNTEKDHLVERILDFRFQIADCSQFENEELDSLKSKIQNARTRAFVKIEDGCNKSCTYCIIPIARGKESSRALGDVVNEVKSLVDTGYQEIILTGVQISAYRTQAVIASEAKPSPTEMKIALGSALPVTHTLRDLVAAILAETAVPRLRLTSIAPWDLDEALLDLFRDPRLCRHLHLSLQSGSTTVLRRMRRPYSTEQFARAVELARAKIPEVGITTDVIVGFPGESNVEFEQSLAFVQQMEFSRIHVFPYSARRGTVAAELPLPVSDVVKQARVKQMQALADASLKAFAAKFIGREMKVLWETAEKDETETLPVKDEDKTFRANDKTLASDLEIHSSSFCPQPSAWSGYTDNYIRVSAPSDLELTNKITPARLLKVIDNGVRGEVVRTRDTVENFGMGFDPRPGRRGGR